MQHYAVSYFFVFASLFHEFVLINKDIANEKFTVINLKGIHPLPLLTTGLDREI